jgi:TonB family protein
MAFGRNEEKLLPEQQNQEIQWTEGDFGKINFQSEKTILSLHIQLDSKSQLIVGNKITDWKEAAVQIRKYLDYNNTSEEMKPAFEKITINGQERMAQKYTALFIESNNSTSRKDYQDFLNSIGNVVLEVRQKYANEIYQTSYKNLSPDQKAEIIRLIPACAMFVKLPVQAVESQKNTPSLYIEVRAEGIYVLPDKNVLTIEQLKEKAEHFSKENGGYVDVRTAPGLKEDNLLKVKEALMGIENLNIRYLPFDPVYTEVEQMAEFPGGNDGLRAWVSKNTIYPNEAKTNGLEGKVYVSLVINSKGKVVFPKITRGLSPDLDAEALRLVSNMPDWKPALQNGYPVSVSYVMPISFSMK